MGEGLLVRRGGTTGGAIKKATIVVSYPSGATCTVYNSSKTYTALDTSGSASFVVDAGTWTVKIAQSGQTTKTKSVTVAAGKYVEVELMFRLYLFNAGDPCADITGGWNQYTSSYGAYAAIENNTLVLDCNGDELCTNTLSTFDVTEFSKLYITFSHDVETGNNRGAKIGLSTSVPSNNYTPPETIYITETSSVTNVTRSIDISSVSGMVAMVIHDGYVGKITISQIWLEK